MTLWEPTLEHIPEGLHLMEGTWTAVVCKELQPAERSHGGKECGGPPPEEEGVSDTPDELIATPIPQPPVPQEGRRWRIHK